jgi:hypothetical protein
MPPEPISSAQINPIRFDSATMEIWLKNLTLQNLSEATRQLTAAVKRLSETPISSPEKLTATQLMSNFALGLAKRFAANLNAMAFPLQIEEQKQLDRLICIFTELGHSYFTLCENRKNDKLKHQCLLQAMRMLGQHYLYSATAYRQAETDFWQYLYHIYQTAEQSGLTEQKTSTYPHTIDQLFKQILIFNQSDINQYRAGDIHRIYEFAGQYAHLIVLYPQDDKPQSHKNQWILDLNSGASPSSFAGKLSDHNVRFFSLHDVAKAMYEDLEKPLPLGQKPLLNKTVQMRLIKALSQSQARKFKRISDSRQCEIIMGFKDIITFLKERQNLNPKSQPDIEMGIMELERVHLEQLKTQVKMKNLNFEQIDKIFAIGNTANTNDTIWHETEAPEITHSMPILDSSIKGYAMLWTNTQKRTRMGEVVGILNPETQQVEIAVVRNISCQAHNEFRLGIELLSFDCTLVSVHASKNDTTGTWNLLLHGIKGLQDEQTLLFPTGSYKKQQFVIIREGQQETFCHLHQVLFTSPSVTQTTLKLN